METKTAETSKAAGSRQYCTFIVADQLFGIDVRNVQEVLRVQVHTHVPLSQPEIAGLLNLRGQILPVIDLRKRLGFPEAGAKRGINLIYASEDGPVDFIADQVGDVITVELSSIDPTPETLEGKLKENVTGIHKLEHSLLLILDPAKVAAVEG
jgi:purine-binding chemotaxis protein CheW